MAGHNPQPEQNRSSDSIHAQTEIQSTPDISRTAATTYRGKPSQHNNRNYTKAETSAATPGGDQPTPTPDRSINRSVSGFLDHLYTKSTLPERLKALNTPDATEESTSDRDTYIRVKAQEMLKEGKIYTDKQRQKGREFSKLVEDDEFLSHDEQAHIDAVNAAQKKYIDKTISGSHHTDRSEAATIAKSVLRDEVSKEMERITHEIDSLKQEIDQTLKPLGIFQYETPQHIQDQVDSLQQKAEQYQQALLEIEDHYTQVQTFPTESQRVMRAFLNEKWYQISGKEANAKIEREKLLQDRAKNRRFYIQNKMKITAAQLRLSQLEGKTDGDGFKFLKKEYDGLHQEAYRLNQQIEQREQSLERELSNSLHAEAGLATATNELGQIMEESESLRADLDRKSQSIQDQVAFLQQEVKQYQQALLEIEDHYTQVQTFPTEIQEIMYALLAEKRYQISTKEADAKIKSDELLQDRDKTRLGYIQSKMKITAAQLILSQFEVKTDGDAHELLNREFIKLRQDESKLNQEIIQRRQSIEREQSRYRDVQESLTTATKKLDQIMEESESFGAYQHEISQSIQNQTASLQQEAEQYQQALLEIEGYSTHVGTLPTESQRVLRTLLDEKRYQISTKEADTKTKAEEALQYRDRIRLIYIQNRIDIVSAKISLSQLEARKDGDDHRLLTDEYDKLHKEKYKLDQQILQRQRSIEREQSRYRDAQEGLATTTKELDKIMKESELLRVDLDRKSQSLQNQADALQQEAEQYQQTLLEIKDYYANVEALHDEYHEAMYAFLDKKWYQTSAKEANATTNREDVLQNRDRSKLSYIENRLGIISSKLILNQLEAKTDGDDHTSLTEEYQKLHQEAHRLDQQIGQGQRLIKQKLSNYLAVQKDLAAATKKLNNIIKAMAMRNSIEIRSNGRDLGDETNTISIEEQRLHSELENLYDKFSHQRTHPDWYTPDYNPEHYREIDTYTSELAKYKDEGSSLSEEHVNDQNGQDQKWDSTTTPPRPPIFEWLRRQSDNINHTYYNYQAIQNIEILQNKWINNREQLTPEEKRYLKGWFADLLWLNREQSILQQLPDHENPAFTHLTEHIRTRTITDWETNSNGPQRVPDQWPLDEDTLLRYLRSYFNTRKRLLKGDPPLSL